MMSAKSIEGINANTYVKMMSHTATVNIAVFFGITGRIITTSKRLHFGQPGLGYATRPCRAASRWPCWLAGRRAGPDTGGGL